MTAPPAPAGPIEIPIEDPTPEQTARPDWSEARSTGIRAFGMVVNYSAQELREQNDRLIDWVGSAWTCVQPHHGDDTWPPLSFVPSLADYQLHLLALSSWVLKTAMVATAHIEGIERTAPENVMAGLERGDQALLDGLQLRAAAVRYDEECRRAAYVAATFRPGNPLYDVYLVAYPASRRAAREGAADRLADPDRGEFRHPIFAPQWKAHEFQILESLKELSRTAQLPTRAVLPELVKRHVLDKIHS